MAADQARAEEICSKMVKVDDQHQHCVKTVLKSMEEGHSEEQTMFMANATLQLLELGLPAAAADAGALEALKGFTEGLPFHTAVNHGQATAIYEKALLNGYTPAAAKIARINALRTLEAGYSRKASLVASEAAAKAIEAGLTPAAAEAAATASANAIRDGKSVEEAAAAGAAVAAVTKDGSHIVIHIHEHDKDGKVLKYKYQPGSKAAVATPMSAEEKAAQPAAPEPPKAEATQTPAAKSPTPTIPTPPTSPAPPTPPLEAPPVPAAAAPVAAQALATPDVPTPPVTPTPPVQVPVPVRMPPAGQGASTAPSPEAGGGSDSLLKPLVLPKPAKPAAAPAPVTAAKASRIAAPASIAQPTSAPMASSPAASMPVASPAPAPATMAQRAGLEGGTAAGSAAKSAAGSAAGSSAKSAAGTAAKSVSGSAGGSAGGGVDGPASAVDSGDQKSSASASTSQDAKTAAGASSASPASQAAKPASASGTSKAAEAAAKVAEAAKAAQAEAKTSNAAPQSSAHAATPTSATPSTPAATASTSEGEQGEGLLDTIVDTVKDAASYVPFLPFNLAEDVVGKTVHVSPFSQEGEGLEADWARQVSVSKRVEGVLNTERYRYSGTSWPNMVMPPWFVELTDEVCRACEVPERPNSCNANLYEASGFGSLKYAHGSEGMLTSCATYGFKTVKRLGFADPAKFMQFRSRSLPFSGLLLGNLI
ncbi:SHOC2 [Symbiodinium pilosum]|uniref:SHOC2 protein n=1 Tax=Symbiodinium pilosum TaxID=2952 RepID=A0A812IQJ0_SYMPI|nr:SHOC2 [Symbiodinium pilosum]